MRFDGILTSWNEATASGIITPGKGGDDIAVHSAAFPKDGAVPSVGEPLSFEVELGPGGHKRAHRLARPRHASRPAERHAVARSSSAWVTGALLILTASAAVLYASMRQGGERPVPGAQAAAAAYVPDPPHEHRSDPVTASRFARSVPSSCDGRTHCSQMKSCEEAKYFIDNCPGTKMDGDRDGIPCEKQWCKPGQASLQGAY
jgi:cold shock CspA family protein